jgi:hypothetical protein
MGGMEEWRVRTRRGLVAMGMSAALAACGGGGGGGGGDGGGGNPGGAPAAGQGALIDEIEQRFTYIPDQPLDQLFICRVAGSGLTWYLYFQPAGTMQVYTTLDNGQDIIESGSYTHANGTIDFQTSGPGLLLDESTTTIETGLGMIVRFVSPNADCHTYGHRYNATEFAGTVGFDCPASNIQAATQDENAIEFVHRAVPFAFAVPGSLFRQRDRYISGATDPNILRGYGIYRRDGDRFYAYFALDQFDDFDYLSGRFTGGDMAIELDQEAVAGSACPRR